MLLFVSGSAKAVLIYDNMPVSEGHTLAARAKHVAICTGWLWSLWAGCSGAMQLQLQSISVKNSMKAELQQAAP